MSEEKKERRPRGQAALGDIDETKRVVETMLSHEEEQRRAKTERLRQLRLTAERASTNNA
ncbi:hypothetical protein ACLE20_06845 [Rhizobium sp. YIM 134829]|uniref:hypothetical protein n=1 Tax=Rhizobium sp. YIM 134829 TaxID=3390453 RepID=UPI00397A8C8B